MGKRKRVSKALEETERNMYKTFSGAANAVSLLYTQAQSQQKRAYYAGLQDAYEKVLKFVENNSVSKGIQSTGGAHRHHQEAVTEFIQRELDTVERDSPAAPAPSVAVHEGEDHQTLAGLGMGLGSAAFKGGVPPTGRQHGSLGSHHRFVLSHFKPKAPKDSAPVTVQQHQAEDIAMTCNDSNNEQLSQLGLK